MKRRTAYPHERGWQYRPGDGSLFKRCKDGYEARVAMGNDGTALWGVLDRDDVVVAHGTAETMDGAYEMAEEAVMRLSRMGRRLRRRTGGFSRRAESLWDFQGYQEYSDTPSGQLLLLERGGIEDAIVIDDTTAVFFCRNLWEREAIDRVKDLLWSGGLSVNSSLVYETQDIDGIDVMEVHVTIDDPLDSEASREMYRAGWDFREPTTTSTESEWYRYVWQPIYKANTNEPYSVEMEGAPMLVVSDSGTDIYDSWDWGVRVMGGDWLSVDGYVNCLEGFYDYGNPDFAEDPTQGGGRFDSLHECWEDVKDKVPDDALRTAMIIRRANRRFSRI